MAIDPTIAARITREYSYNAAIQQDAGIRALFPNAREIVLDTNLDQAGGTDLANTLWNQTKSFARTFTVMIEDVLFPEDFLLSPNRYVINFGRHPAAGTNVIYTVLRARINYSAGRTTLTVRG